MKKAIIWSIIMTVITLFTFFITLHFTGNKDQASYVTTIIVAILFLSVPSYKGADGLRLMMFLCMVAFVFIILKIFFDTFIVLVVLVSLITTLISLLAIIGESKIKDKIIFSIHIVQFIVTLTPMLCAIKV